MFPALERHPAPLVVSAARAGGNPIVFVNDAFKRHTGFSTADVVGKSLNILHGPETDPAIVANIESALSDVREIEAEILQYRKDGTSFWGSITVVPVFVDAETTYFMTAVTIAQGGEPNSAEVALSASQKQVSDTNARLRVMLSLTGAIAAWEWDITKNKILGDPRFATLYGIRPEVAASGVSPEVFFSIIHPDDRPRVRLAIGGILRGAEVFSKEFRILLANHSVRWVQARGRCQYDSSERPSRFSGVLVDITEQKLAAERLRIAQSAGGIGTFEHIEGFATATVSPHFCRLLGLQPAHTLPIHTINSVVHPGDAPLIASQHGGSPEVNTELRIVRPDTGEIRWLAKRGEYLRDAETAGLRFSGVIYDVTASKLTEESLLTLNETLESRVQQRTQERDGVWRLSKDLLGIADANGVWLDVNPAWTRTLGWEASEIVGRTSQGLLHPEDSAQTRRLFEARDGTSVSFQNRLRTRQGEYRSLAWTAVPQSGHFYCVARDVTEQLRREDSLARAEDQLRQAHKMEAVGQLTGGIAHDFNNMLTGVIASLGLIQRRIKSGRTDGLDEFIEAGMNSASRAATLTHSLLAFARRQSLDVKSQDLNAVITGIQEILRRPLGEDIALDLQLDESLWFGLTDANQFESALLNLVLNSRDAMPEGGRVTIATANEQMSLPALVHDGEISPGDYVVVSVSDSGSGMAPDVIAKVFEPFFTTKPIGEGTGLGLSMIHGFVKQSGGYVRIESKPGHGTTVKIYFRRAATEDKPIAAVRGRPLPRSRGETVLVVEDDSSVRFTITELLKELGYAYFEASDAATAIPFLQSRQRIDLLVSDVGLPNMNGRQLAEVGRQLRPELKVLLISGYSEKAAERGGFLGPGMQMLGKPFTVDTLGAKIRELIEQ
jgi:PAS domain S-box-containing protein